MRQINAGEVISFNYQGGSNPGKKRTVCVVETVINTENDKRLIKGYDLGVCNAHEQFRNFHIYKCQNICLLTKGKDYQILDCTILPSNYTIYDFHDIVKSHHDSDNYACYDEERNKIIVLVKQDTSNIHLDSDGFAQLECRTKNGVVWITKKIDGKATLEYTLDGHQIEELEPSVENLYNVLRDILNK